MKINNFRGDISDISAKTATLLQGVFQAADAHALLSAPKHTFIQTEANCASDLDHLQQSLGVLPHLGSSGPDQFYRLSFNDKHRRQAVYPRNDCKHQHDGVLISLCQY